MCFCSLGRKLVEFYVCRGTKLIVNHISIPVYKFYAVQWRGLDLSPFTNLSWVQEHLPAGRQESKNHDKLINYTVRVMGQALFICLSTRKIVLI